MGVEAFWWGIVSAVSLPLGAVIGLWWKPNRRISSSFTAFGAGALLFALTIELFAHVPHHVEKHGFGAFVASAVGAVAGGILFDVLNQMLNNRGAFLRRLSHARRHVVRLRLKRTRRLVEELSRVEVLQHLRPREMAQVIQGVDERHFEAGEIIFEQGDVGREMYFIVSGKVDIVVHEDAQGDRPREVATLGKHGVFGELSVLRDAPHAAQARAVTAVRTYRIGKEDFEEVLAASPELQEAVRELADSRGEALSRHGSGVLGEEWKSETMMHLAEATHAVSAKDIVEEGKASGAGGAGLAIWLGILIDGIPESLVIGMLAIGTKGVSLSFIVGVFLANLPEAMSSAVSMQKNGMRYAKIMVMWGSICIMTGIGAFIGATVFPAHPEGALFFFVLGIEGLAAGAMLTMIAETMLPEAYEQGGAIVGLSTLAGFIVTLFVKVL